MIKIVDYVKEKSHVIWDWNGTLLSDIQHAVNVVNVLLTEEKLSTIDIPGYKQTFGFPVVKYYEQLGFDISPDNFKDLCERFNQRFYEDLHLCELWPGARETLSTIKNAGKMQSVLSASEQTMLNGSIKKFDLVEVFDHVVGINDKLAGSKVEFGRKLLSRLDVPLEETVLIGDTDHDLEVGEALGIDVILVDHGHQTVERLKAVHHTVVTVL